MSAPVLVSSQSVTSPLGVVDGMPAPEAPRNLEETGTEKDVLLDLALKWAGTAPQITTKWLADNLMLPVVLVEELLQQLTTDRLVEVLGMEALFNRRYAVTGRGRERIAYVKEICGYVGPAPVSLDDYAAMLHFQRNHLPEVALDQVQAALSELVLPSEDILTAALAVISQRSLFLYGPSGNGKTSLARLLHNAIGTDLWIPHAFSVGHEVVRLFDPQVHEQITLTLARPWLVDGRWLKVRRPLVVAGGEMTLESLELAGGSARGSARGTYEAPLHMKSNGGTFVIDDLGRQRVEPSALLNRWIVPLEHGYDFFLLQSGRKIQVPFLQMLIVATNLDPDKVMDPAFLRRMGYRLLIDSPSPERYTQILRNVARRWNVSVPDSVVHWLLERYHRENRELRCCEPRDLLGRVYDMCHLRRLPMQIDNELLDVAWTTYFGTKGARP